MIPLQHYSFALRVIALILTLTLVAGTGALINGWRVKSNLADELAERDRVITQLRIEVEKQNSAVALMRQASDAANAARQRAEREALAQRNAAKVRDEWISRLKGTCEENLRDAWGRL